MVVESDITMTDSIVWNNKPYEIRRQGERDLPSSTAAFADGGPTWATHTATRCLRGPAAGSIAQTRIQWVDRRTSARVGRG